MTSHVPAGARWALVVLLCAVAGAAAHASVAAAGAYRIADLGLLPGTSRSFGDGINASGAVVGYGGYDEVRQAFIWEAGSGLRPLGTLVPGGESIAHDVNGNGIVVGEATTARYVFHAFLWDGLGMTDLGSLGGRDAFSAAHDVNVSRQVVGGSWTRKGPMHAFIWQGKRMKDLGVPPGLDESYAEAINNAGVVVGRAWGATSAEHAFVYDGTMRDLGTFDAFQGGASDINDDGTIVGYRKANPGYPRAVVYAAGIVIEIPPLYGTSTRGATANAINNRGQVVGDSDERAFLFEDGRLVDLNTLLPAGSGWVLTSATDINDAGTIVGTGLHFGQERAYKLSLTPLARYVPELRYDAQEIYRADSAAEITDNYTASYTNRLLRADGTLLAASDPSYPADDLSLDYLGANAGSSLESDYVDEANDNRDADAQRMHADPYYANKVYGREVPLTDGGVLLQYWVFYYNNPKTFFTAGDHEGDWEMIQVHLDPNEVPLGATYAQHKTGERCDWSHIERTSTGRPIVYVAQESARRLGLCGRRGRARRSVAHRGHGGAALAAVERPLRRRGQQPPLAVQPGQVGRSRRLRIERGGVHRARRGRPRARGPWRAPQRAGRTGDQGTPRRRQRRRRLPAPHRAGSRAVAARDDGRRRARPVHADEQADRGRRRSAGARRAACRPVARAAPRAGERAGRERRPQQDRGGAGPVSLRTTGGRPSRGRRRPPGAPT